MTESQRDTERLDWLMKHLLCDDTEVAGELRSVRTREQIDEAMKAEREALTQKT